MREVKVGQVWRWDFKDGEEGNFAITHVSAQEVSYKYLSSDFASTAPLDYFDSDAVLVKDVKESVEEAPETENNQLSPNVYQFPNGVEVKDISAHLTSFGGQAVQYIARATRLDGVVKGLPVQDLYKAIELLKWEAERMEALEESK